MNIIIMIGCLLGGLIGLMLSFYLTLCFIGWVLDVIDKKEWRWWF
jgi:hypothetical protein